MNLIGSNTIGAMQSAMHGIIVITILNHFGELFGKHWPMFAPLLLLDFTPGVNVVFPHIVQAFHMLVLNFKSSLLIAEFEYVMKKNNNGFGIISSVLLSFINYIN